VLDTETRRELQQRFYPLLYERVFAPMRAALEGLLQDGGTVLDAGCGGGTWLLQPYRSQLQIVGTDIWLPGQVQDIPLVLSDLSHAPFSDCTFDLIICYNVIEHMRQPNCVFAEFARMLKLGGVLALKTPSLWAPLVVLSRVTPHALHRELKERAAGADESDVFPTYYQCNTPGRLEQCLHAAGFRREKLFLVDQTYEFLTFSRLAYGLGLLYSRMIQAGSLRWLGTGIAGIYLKAVP